MKFLLLALVLMAPMASVYADELDNENQVRNAQRFAADLPQTLVVQVNKTDGSVAVMHSNQKLDAKEIKFDSSKFVSVKSTESMRGKNELDKDSSASGWYFYWYNYSYSYPTYYYYGYNYSYQSYYSYYNYYNNCNYYYYRWY